MMEERREYRKREKNQATHAYTLCDSQGKNCHCGEPIDAGKTLTLLLWAESSDKPLFLLINLMVK